MLKKNLWNHSRFFCLAYLLIFLFTSSSLLQSQEKPCLFPYQDIAEKIQNTGLKEERALVLLEKLTSTIGPRLTGSPNAAAVELMRQAGGGGPDIAPLAEQGTVTMGLVPDSQRYFDVHHSALDVLSSVHPRELEIGAITMAIMAFILSQEGV
jgi:hypothetical protein